MGVFGLVALVSAGGLGGWAGTEQDTFALGELDLALDLQGGVGRPMPVFKCSSLVWSLLRVNHPPPLSCALDRFGVPNSASGVQRCLRSRVTLSVYA